MWQKQVYLTDWRFAHGACLAEKGPRPVANGPRRQVGKRLVDDGRRHEETDLDRRTQAARTSNLSTKSSTVGRSASRSKSSMKS